LREAGIPQEQAEAHATAARDFVMAELVTKTDLNQRFDAQAALFDQKLETLGLKLTVRLGVMLAAAIAILSAIMKLA
jgi:hypothetical protein